MPPPSSNVTVTTKLNAYALSIQHRAPHTALCDNFWGIAERLKTSNFGIFELFGDDLLNKLNGETKIVDFFGFVGLDTPK